jgi:hypothetical protein
MMVIVSPSNSMNAARRAANLVCSIPTGYREWCSHDFGLTGGC